MVNLHPKLSTLKTQLFGSLFVISILMSALIFLLDGEEEDGRAKRTKCDQIDGTDVWGKDNDLDGVGIWGTIDGLGSILVNGLMVAFDSDQAVSINGEKGSIEDLKIDQVVMVHAEKIDDKFHAKDILIRYEVVGPYEIISDRKISVLGQVVLLPENYNLPKEAKVLAVSGYRAEDNIINATRIDEKPQGHQYSIWGILENNRGGYKVSGLTVVNLRPLKTGDALLHIRRAQGGGWYAEKVVIFKHGSFGRVMKEVYLRK